MYKLIKRLLFMLSPERAHYLTMNVLRAALAVPGVGYMLERSFRLTDDRLGRQLFGLHFPNPVGLAAGFDKDARFISQLSTFGFGFIEIGTITPKAQSGNPRPRLFRLPVDQALINRMGFNNNGVEVAIDQLRNRPEGLIVGGNIGKNKVTKNEDSLQDYQRCFDALYPYVDYFVVNVSSPNTPDLRQLQDKEPLTHLLTSLMEEKRKKDSAKPILLKIAPDLTNEQLDDIIAIVNQTGIDGLIATNTTVSRAGLMTDPARLNKIGLGGLSGAPLHERSNEVIRYLKRNGLIVPIIGVGGVMDEQSALEKLEAGAELIQLYTGFIFEGPGLIRRINRAILNKIEQG